ncbi:MAG: APC family permease, partial [Oligoflexales bacterium]|nr:APC family permease [Oligoflexales bacterium]
TVSIAAAGDALFSFLPSHLHQYKIAFDLFVIFSLTILNARGVKESVIVLTPIFILFLLTHIVGIVGGIIGHVPESAAVTAKLSADMHTGISSIGMIGVILLFLHAYSLGGGTYTGLEAVSNGLMIMREPRVPNAKTTMLYMAVSLAFTAGGLLLCYLLWNVEPVEGKTLNAVLFEKMTANIPFGNVFVIITLITEGALLIVGAQAGFLDGPRVLANMAIDYWAPTKFAALSDRLTTQNGIVLMAVSSMAALLYAHGNVSNLVVMYSINVFLTFSLSMFGMLKFYWNHETKDRVRTKRIALFSIGFIFCINILVITVMEKFSEGGWITVAVTSGLVFLCFLIRSHYRGVAKKLNSLPTDFNKYPKIDTRPFVCETHGEHIAAVLVGGYGGFGIYTIHNILKTFPGQFSRFIFISVGVIDSGELKGKEAVDALQKQTESAAKKYVDLVESLGLAGEYITAIGTDTVHEIIRLCQKVAREHKRVIFFSGKVVFQKENWYQRILHNETAFSVQKELQLAGMMMVVIPTKIT